MNAILAFAVVLLFAVLLSELAHRSILSSAVMFLVAGFVLGNGMLNVVSISSDNEVVRRLADLALFTMLAWPDGSGDLKQRTKTNCFLNS